MRVLGRRGAAVLAFVVAGSASIATSPPPQPVASETIEYKETFGLNAATPVAVRRLSVLVNAGDSGVDIEAVLSATIETPGVTTEAIGLTILPDQPGSPQQTVMTERGGALPETVFFAYDRGHPANSSCSELPCARTYRVIVELADVEVADKAQVSFRAAGALTVRGVEKVPAGMTFRVDPVDDLVLFDYPPDIHASSEPQEAEIGGPDRQGAEVHAMVTFRGDALAANPVWPVVPEIILHVDAADDAAREIAAGQLSLLVEQPAEAAPGRAQVVVFAPEQLPYSVSLQPIPGCGAGPPCVVPIDATLGAQSPGDRVPLRWWIETRVRYFDGAPVPAEAAVEITSLTEAEFAAQSLDQCKGDALLVLFEARERGILTEAEFKIQLDAYDAGTWDPAFVEELDGYEELCRAVMREHASEGATPSPPPSELDPFAPRAEATLAEETRVLNLETPVFIRDIRLTRNAAAADPAGAAAIGYLQVETSARHADPRVLLNAFVQILPLDGGDPVFPRSDIRASDLAGPPIELSPWLDCQALAACSVDLRIVFAWWDWEPLSEQEVSWQLKAGTAWPGLPDAPEGAEVRLEQIRSLDVTVDTDTIDDRTAGTDIVLAGDGATVTRNVKIELSGASWPAELTNIPMPGHGLFTVSAAATGTGPAPVIGTLIRPTDQSGDRGASGLATINGAELTQAFYPFITCKGRAPCVSEYTVEFTRLGKGGDFGPITVEWSIDATLRAFESIEFPAGAELTIQIGD